MNTLEHFQDWIVNEETLLSLFVSDFDLTAAYPMSTIAFNISKEACLYSVYEIENRTKSDIFDFFSCLIGKKENAVYLCEKYFNLPNFIDLKKHFT